MGWEGWLRIRAETEPVDGGGRLSLSSAKATPLPERWSGGADAHPGVSLCQRGTDRED